MKGYLYKEWKQNRMLFLLTAVIAIEQVFLPIQMFMVDSKTISREVFLNFYVQGGDGVRMLVTILAAFCVLAVQELLFRNDDMKAWGLFVASNPKGIKGYILTKYGLAFTMIMSFFVLSAGFDYIFIKIANVIGGLGLVPGTGVLWIVTLIMIFWSALEMPFVIRFGMKLGNTIKLILLIASIIAVMVVFIANPLGIVDAIFAFFAGKEIPFSLKWGLPVISFGAYILSGLISCKLYIKGVFQYYR